MAVQTNDYFYRYWINKQENPFRIFFVPRHGFWRPEVLLWDWRCFNLLMRTSIYVLSRYLTEFVSVKGGLRISVCASITTKSSKHTAFEYRFPAFSASPITSSTCKKSYSNNNNQIGFFSWGLIIRAIETYSSTYAKSKSCLEYYLHCIGHLYIIYIDVMWFNDSDQLKKRNEKFVLAVLLLQENVYPIQQTWQVLQHAQPPGQTLSESETITSLIPRGWYFFLLC